MRAYPDSSLLSALFRGLSEMLPPEGKMSLKAAILAFMSQEDKENSEESFAEAVKTIVDRLSL